MYTGRQATCDIKMRELLDMKHLPARIPSTAQLTEYSLCPTTHALHSVARWCFYRNVRSFTKLVYDFLPRVSRHSIKFEPLMVPALPPRVCGVVEDLNRSSEPEIQ